MSRSQPTFILRMTIEVVTNIGRPHQVETKNDIYLQATLIQEGESKYLVFPTYMWEKTGSLHLINEEDGTEILLNPDDIHYSKALSLAYLDVENVSDTKLQSIFQSMKGLPLAQSAPEPGEELLTWSFDCEARCSLLKIQKASDSFNFCYFSWYKPEQPFKRIEQSTKYLHSDGTSVKLYFGNGAPADKIVGFTNPILLGAPVVTSSKAKRALVGLTQGGNWLRNENQMVMSARVIQLLINHQTAFPNREIEFVSLPVSGYLFSKGEDAGKFFSSAGLLVSNSGCDIKQGEFVTDVDGHSFNGDVALQIGGRSTSLDEYLLLKAVEHNYTATLRILNSDREARDQSVELYRSSEKPLGLLTTIPTGELPYLIMGHLVLSYVYSHPYKESPRLEGFFGNKRLIHIAHILESDKTDQKYEGFLVDNVEYRDGNQYRKQEVTSIEQLAQWYDEIPIGRDIRLECYANISEILKGKHGEGPAITNFRLDRERRILGGEQPTGPEKILYSVCCTKENFAQNSDFKRLGFEKDRSKSIPTFSDGKENDEPTLSPMSSPPPAIQEKSLSPLPPSHQPIEDRAADLKDEKLALDHEQIEQIKQASISLTVSMDLSTVTPDDPIARMSFVREVAGTIVRFGEHHFIVTALPILSLGFRDAWATLGEDNLKIGFGPSQTSFDAGIDMAFLSLPFELEKEKIPSVAMVNEFVDFAGERGLHYQAKASRWCTPCSSSPYKEQQSTDTELKLSFRKYECIKTIGGWAFCAVASASFTVNHELRGGPVYNDQGMMTGMVIAIDDAKQTVYILPSQMICRSLQMLRAQSKQSMGTYSSIVLPPPLRTQTLSHPAQKRYYFGGPSSDVSGVLVIQAEFYQSPGDPIHREGFKPPSELREHVLTALTLVDQDSGVLRYAILPNGCVEHPRYQQVPWTAIFSLHAIKDNTLIEAEFYNPKGREPRFTKSFPIKRTGALIYAGQQEYEKLPDNPLWVTFTNFSILGFAYSYRGGPLWRMPLVREHRYSDKNDKRQVDRKGTICGYPVVCHGEFQNSNRYQEYAFRPAGQGFTTIVSAEGGELKILYPENSLSDEWDDKTDIDENDERWSVVQLLPYMKENPRGSMNGERFLPLSTGLKNAATGFAIKKEGQIYLVTNRHVAIANCTLEIWVRTPDGLYQLGADSMRNIISCSEWDLAIIPIFGPLAKKLKPLSLAETSQMHDSSSKVTVKGYPGGDGRQLTTLPITGLSTEFQDIINGYLSTMTLLYTGKGIIGGSSGSPILNAKNEVMGVVHQGYSQTVHMQGVCVESLWKLLEALLSRESPREYCPGILPFKLESPLQVSVGQPPPALTKEIEAYGLKEGDIIEEIDGCPVTAEGKIRYCGMEISLVEYACTKLAGAEFDIQISRCDGEEVIRKTIESFPLLDERKTGYSRYYKNPAPSRMIVLGKCMLTEVSGKPKRAINEGIHRFFTETENRKLQLTWYCNFPPDWGDDVVSDASTVSLTVLYKKQGWIVQSINGHEIIDFRDVLKAMQEDCETITLVLQDHADTSITSTTVQFPRLTDKQLLELAEYHHWPRSIVINSGLIMSRTVAEDCDVPLQEGYSPLDQICPHGLPR